MKIGILQTGHFPDALQGDMGNYDDMFQRLLAGHGFTFQTWPVVDMTFPDSAQDADGWLVTGSRHGAYEDLPFIPPLEDLIREINTSARPLIGVCFGHQIIAQALGGKVEKFEGGWSVGRTEYVTSQGDGITLNAWHQDQVTRPPEGACTLASSEFCEHAVLAYGDHIWTMQPHPEFDATVIDGLARTRGKGLVPDPLLATAQSQLTAPIDRDKIASQMAEFFLKSSTNDRANA
ncbi:MAG: type 1 glutamine amidotransferase [Aliishimia sp.]